MPRGENFKGKRPPGAGRKKGTPNKSTPIKQAIEEAFNAVGGAAWLFSIHGEHPEILANLVGKILPKQIEQSGPNQGPIIIRSNVHDD